MSKSIRIGQPLLGAAAFGVMGLAASGILHPVNAAADSVSLLPADQVVVHLANQGLAKPDGSFCSPYGCTGCSGCVSLEYLQNVAESPALISNLETNSQVAQAASVIWKSCPRGLVNCAYPGKCNLYVDTNRDRICDRSQSAPQTAAAIPAATTAVKTAATTTSVTTATKTVTTTAAISAPSTTPGASAGGILAAAVPGDSSGTSSGSGQAASATTPVAPETGHSYYFVPVLLAIALLYALTWILSAKKVIRTLLHRKIWNVVLLVSMVVSALLGLFLILSIDFNISITLPFNMLFWHVEAGIALGIVGVFHILWHWRYFAKMFRAAAPATVETKNELRQKPPQPLNHQHI